MKAQIIQIGNSQGIRIPKALLQETGISGDVELEVHAEGILIKNVNMPRSDWDDKFRAAAEFDDDIANDGRVSTEFEKKEWQW